jgi:hypothetical protein
MLSRLQACPSFNRESFASGDRLLYQSKKHDDITIKRSRAALHIHAIKRKAMLRRYAPQTKKPPD